MQGRGLMNTKRTFLIHFIEICQWRFEKCTTNISSVHRPEVCVIMAVIKIALAISKKLIWTNIVAESQFSFPSIEKKTKQNI